MENETNLNNKKQKINRAKKTHRNIIIFYILVAIVFILILSSIIYYEYNKYSKKSSTTNNQPSNNSQIAKIDEYLRVLVKAEAVKKSFVYNSSKKTWSIDNNEFEYLYLNDFFYELKQEPKYSFYNLDFEFAFNDIQYISNVKINYIFYNDINIKVTNSTTVQYLWNKTLY